MKEEELDKLIHLCRIECTAEERNSLRENLSKVLDYVQELQAVNTQGVEPCLHVLKTHTNVMREDLVGPLLSREEFLANAPAHVGGMIRVPPVIRSGNP